MMGQSSRILYGVPCIEFDHDKSIRLENAIIKPQVRMLGELSDVTYDKEFSKNSDPNKPLYYMYRDLNRQVDSKMFDNAQLRFDVTIVEPLHLGVERNKTLGHYHKHLSSGLSHPELYEVVEGEAHYLLQFIEKGILREVVVVKAGKGDIVLIPSGYWHITINASDEMLVMASLIWRGVESDYEPIREWGGGAYFELINGEFAPNENYASVPPIKYFKPEQTFRRLSNKALYSQFIEEPASFDFLANPVNSVRWTGT